MDKSARLSRATAVVCAQAGCNAEEALTLLAERAQVEHLTLWALAAAVLDETIRFN